MTKASIKLQTTISTVERFSLELDRAALTELIRAAYPGIPDSATIYFHVPGGGDWSNTCIDIDAENPVRVQWQVNSVEDRP